MATKADVLKKLVRREQELQEAIKKKSKELKEARVEQEKATQSENPQ